MMKDLSMHIMDIVQNSIVAGATFMQIEISEDTRANNLTMSIEDNGHGMSDEFLQNVRNPFVTSRTTRKVGLGIPFLAQTCDMNGGELTITSEVGVGTTICATMKHDTIDRPPLGEMGATIHVLIVTNPDLDFRYVHRFNEEEFYIDTREVREVLGDDVPLSSMDVSAWLKENIDEGLASLI